MPEQKQMNLEVQEAEEVQESTVPAEAVKTEVVKKDYSHLPVWQQKCIVAEEKMSLIINPERVKAELGFVLQAFEKNTDLKKCEPNSILNAVINIARTGITLNPIMKLAYLVPRKNQCVLDISYMGLIKTLKDNKCIRHIEAFCVYEDEEFENDITNGKITHIPKDAASEAEQKKRKLRGAYSRAILPDGDIVYCYMPAWEIYKVKDSSPASKSNFSPWKTWEGEMIKKTVIKRHFKTLISGNATEQLQAVMQIEEENNGIDFEKQKRKPSIADMFDSE